MKTFSLILSNDVFLKIKITSQKVQHSGWIYFILMLQYFAEKTSFVLDYKEKYKNISTVLLVSVTLVNGQSMS